MHKRVTRSNVAFGATHIAPLVPRRTQTVRAGPLSQGFQSSTAGTVLALVDSMVFLVSLGAAEDVTKDCF